MKRENKKVRYAVSAWNGTSPIPVEVMVEVNEVGIAAFNTVVLDSSGTAQLPYKLYCPKCRCLFEANGKDGSPFIDCPCCSTPLEQPWRMTVYEPLLNCSYDGIFQCCKNLTWYPWVGKGYDTHRILVFGDSHYVNSKTEAERLGDIQLWLTDRWSTREVVSEYPILGREDACWKNNGKRSNNPTFDNLITVLTGNPLLDPAEKNLRIRLWRALAFLNFFQRPLQYRPDGPKERPKTADRFPAWEAALHVISTLKPRLCIFAGVDAAKYYNRYMHQLEVKTTELIETRIPGSSDKKLMINRCNPREATISINGTNVLLQFIKHPGKYFSCPKWRRHLLSRIPWLKSVIDGILA